MILHCMFHMEHSQHSLEFSTNIVFTTLTIRLIPIISRKAPLQLLSSIYTLLNSPSGIWLPFQSLNLNTVGRTPCTGGQPVARPLRTHRTTQKQNKGTQTSMRRAGFEPTFPVFEQTKTVHALDRAATLIGTSVLYR